jgi:hypothetical protein
MKGRWLPRVFVNSMVGVVRIDLSQVSRIADFSVNRQIDGEYQDARTDARSISLRIIIPLNRSNPVAQATDGLLSACLLCLFAQDHYPRKSSRQRLLIRKIQVHHDNLPYRFSSW